MLKRKSVAPAVASILAATQVMAGAHVPPEGVVARDQDVSNGIVSADTVVTPVTGWLVVHRTDDDLAPGAVVGYAPLREGGNEDVAAILQEEIAPGDKLMLMVHSEEGGKSAGIFEYTSGATEDGPIRKDGELVMAVISAL